MAIITEETFYNRLEKKKSEAFDAMLTQYCMPNFFCSCDLAETFKKQFQKIERWATNQTVMINGLACSVVLYKLIPHFTTQGVSSGNPITESTEPPVSDHPVQSG